MTGTVKFFNAQRGWGYIDGEDGLCYFVHWREIKNMDGFKCLYDNQVVTFDPNEGEKGLQALNVEPQTPFNHISFRDKSVLKSELK